MQLDIPVIGILRGIEAGFFGAVIAASFANGLQAIEVTVNTAGAEEMVSRFRPSVPPGRMLGMGTLPGTRGSGHDNLLIFKHQCSKSRCFQSQYRPFGHQNGAYRNSLALEVDSRRLFPSSNYLGPTPSASAPLQFFLHHKHLSLIDRLYLLFQDLPNIKS